MTRAARWSTGLLALLCAALPGQVETPANKQQLAESKFRDLTERMQRMLSVLQRETPADADLLAAGLRFVREQHLHDDLQRASQLLAAERWDEALAEMGKVRDNLARLLALLQNRSLDLRQLQQRINSLSAMRERVAQLAQEQAAQKDDSARKEELEQKLRAAGVPPEERARQLDFANRQAAQAATERATDALAKDMEQAEQENAGEQFPGRKHVQQAVPKQRNASEHLQAQRSPKQAQQDAKDELQSAKEELDQRIEQLRKQMQDEVLRALEEQFAAMQKEQLSLSEETKTLDRTRMQAQAGNAELPSSLRERIRAVATGERQLQAQAEAALKTLQEEATTAVFPELLADLIAQLAAVVQACDAQTTNAAVQGQQAEVVRTLDLLLAALRNTIERKEAGQEPSSEDGGPPPLVSVSAELKMLKFLQERVNVATKELHAQGEAQRLEGGPALADRQGRVRDLTRRLADKLAAESAKEERK